MKIKIKTKVNRTLQDIKDQFNLLEVVFIEANPSKIASKYWINEIGWPWRTKTQVVSGEFMVDMPIEKFFKDNPYHYKSKGTILSYPYLEIHFKSKLVVEYTFISDKHLYRAFNDLNKLLNDHQKWLQN